ncbi:MAG: hypothetical protein KR126chlam2_01136 [Chlamydiae bacterium]|nr:hypothetical protein [Chlamydiota bacterium]
MNKKFSGLIVCLLFVFSVAWAGEFTVCSYNCGGLSDHYDYLRAACMQKLMHERHDREPATMDRIEKMQQLALKILFSQDPIEQAEARRVWEEGKYQQFYERLTLSPDKLESPNSLWFQKSEEMITSYKVRPVQLYDDEVARQLSDHLNDLTGGKKLDLNQLLDESRRTMGERIFRHHLKYDIICLQEADYLDASMFPDHFETRFSSSDHSVNGVAWNKERYELTDEIGEVLGRAFVVELRDKECGKTLLVASGHLSGCNPFQVEEQDSAKGDRELQAIVQLFEGREADIKLVALDANVTVMHPRLAILRDSDYQFDSESRLEPTCTNPNLILNTRIDWIAVKGGHSSITHIPVLGVDLNTIQTNVSDHKPIAARIHF